jgi:hypothetical protein
VTKPVVIKKCPLYLFFDPLQNIEKNFVSGLTSDWLCVKIIKDLQKRWGVTIYGRSIKAPFLQITSSVVQSNAKNTSYPARHAD